MLLICTHVLAAETGIASVESMQAISINIQPLDVNGDAVVPEGNFYPGACRLRVTCTGAQQDDGFNLIMVMSDDTGIPTKDNLYYINTPSSSGDDGIVYNVYPKNLQDGKYEIWVTDTAGNHGAVKAATFLFKSSNAITLLGDVDENGEVDILDALAIMRHDVKLTGYDLTGKKSVADINHDGNIDMLDALIAMRHDVGLLDIQEVYGS